MVLWKPRTWMVALAAGACLAAGVGAMTACLTDPPPDLTPSSSLGPQIVTVSLIPPEGEPLTQWPVGGFVVPVRNVDPSACQYSVTPRSLGVIECSPCGGIVQNGRLLIPLPLRNQLDPNLCDQIVTFYVARQFKAGSNCTAYDEGQGDTAEWHYYPPSCPIYDAGAVQDGAFPPPDAPPDGVLVVPESGVDP